MSYNDDEFAPQGLPDVDFNGNISLEDDSDLDDTDFTVGTAVGDDDDFTADEQGFN